MLTNICSQYEHQYLDILGKLLDLPAGRPDRTGTGTRALFGVTLTHDWADGFPLITHRTLNPRAAMAEMSCFIKGYTDIGEFVARGCTWWEGNLADFNTRNNCLDNTNLGPIYGSKWSNFHGTDQLVALINEARTNPTSRRLLVTAWDPSDQAKAVLPPCHYSFQIFINGDDLDLLYNMRSVDWILGCPNDMVAYAFLQLALCRELGKNPGRLIQHSADTHIYENHVEAAEQMLNTQAGVERRLPHFSWLTAERPGNSNPPNFFQLEATNLYIEKVEQGPSVRFQMAV